MSEEFSLFALMDSHLSKTRLNHIQMENNENKAATSASDVLLPTPSGSKLVIPNFFPGNSPMKDFLAEQISNTLKAKVKRKLEEEQKKIEDEMKKLIIKEKEQFSVADDIANINLHEEQDYIIDLTPAIIKQPIQKQTEVQPHVSSETTTKCSKLKLAKLQTLPKLPLRWDKETCLYKPWNPNLPCTTDISFILQQKIKRGKCSSFGKVLCSRLRPVHHISIPYEAEKFQPNIVRFIKKIKGDQKCLHIGQ